MATVLEPSPLRTSDPVAELVIREGDPEEVLSCVVALIARQFAADVCSVYLLQPDRAHLILAATLGLRRESVGQLRMGLHEGLAGLVAQQLRPVAVLEAAKHPRFKFFCEAGEEAYQSFLGVPLVDGGGLHGVLVIQTIEPRDFSNADIERLTAAAADLAPIISEVRMLEQFIAPAQDRLW